MAQLHLMVYFCSYSNNHVFDVPIGGKIPDLDHIFPNGGELQWSKELAVSALHYTGESAEVTSYFKILLRRHLAAASFNIHQHCKTYSGA